MNSRLFSSYLVSVSRAEMPARARLARARGYGIEIKDFAWHGVLTDRGMRKRVLSAYRQVLPLVEGPVVAHGPFDDLAFGGSDPDIVAVSRKRASACLDAVEELGVPRVVFHTCWTHADPQPWFKLEWVKRHAEFWHEVLTGRRTEVLLENLWDPEPELFAAALDAVGLEAVGACLDVGHAHVHSKFPPSRWVEVVGKRVRHLHVHDNRREYDEHLTPGEGTIHWPALARALRAQGLQPTATLELRLDQVEEAVQFLDGL